MEQMDNGTTRDNSSISGRLFIDLRNANLSHVKFAGEDLQDVDLTSATLWEADLSNTILLKAWLQRKSLAHLPP